MKINGSIEQKKNFKSEGFIQFLIFFFGSILFLCSFTSEFSGLVEVLEHEDRQLI